MRYIKINEESNGSHLNQCGGTLPSNEWAIIPDDLLIPNSFPFVDIIVEDGIVTEIIAKEIPEPIVPEDMIDDTELSLLILADHEERLCLIEMGINE